MLVDPQFLFRFEREPASVAPGSPFQLGDYELASRLSFFLWSSIPDAELLAEAGRGTLKDPAVLRAAGAADAGRSQGRCAGRQLRRPVAAAARAAQRAARFARVGREPPAVVPARNRAAVPDDHPRGPQRRSISSMPTSRSSTSVWRGTTAFPVFAARGCVASLSQPDDPRRGLLGQGSILTVTSAANRTSPVTRGKWVLENVLGAPPPPPPPGVETNLEEDAAQVKVTSLRQRMELHRANPACASCHKLMDPIGFSLENFDNTGKWRTVDGTATIDASGRLADGTG